MKSFFEENGFVILAAIVVIILIAMATPLGGLVKSQITNIVDSFSNKTQSKLNATDGIIQVRVSTANNKITLEWDANKKEDVFKYQYKASNTSKDGNWTNVASISNGSDKTRKVEITKDSNDQPLANKTKVEYKIYDSNDQLVASGVVTAKVGKSIDGGSGGTGGDPDGGSTENPSTPIETLNAGQKIIIADNEYTVIENVQGSKYKVLANDTFEKAFDDNKSSNYATSSIATYLDNDYFDTLSESIRNAIVETSIQQKALKTWNNNNPTDWGAPIDAGKYRVFIPSWEEVTKIYGTTPEVLKEYAPNGLTWLRDTVHGRQVLDVGRNGNLGFNGPGNRIFVRPAFVINLSNVDYTKK